MSTERFSSWSKSGYTLASGAACPICGDARSKKQCKPAPSYKARGGWICHRTQGAIAQETEHNEYFCIHASGEWSTWLPITSLNDRDRNRPRQGESAAALAARQAEYRKRQSELAEAATTLTTGPSAPTDTHRVVVEGEHQLEAEPAWLEAALALEQERIVLAPVVRHQNLLALLQLVAEPITGDRLLEVQQRLGLGPAPATVWGVGLQPQEGDAELPSGWIRQRLATPVPGAMPISQSKGGGFELLAGAGIWWPILGLNGALLGFEIASDRWRRQLWPETPKYRPLSKESASKAGEQPSPYTWRVAVGLERLEPPMGCYGPRPDGICREADLASARGLLLTEGRAVKPRATALRWGLPAAGGHGHAAFATVSRQLDAVLRLLPPEALVLLAPDAGGVSNAAVLEQLLRTAGRVVLQGRVPRIAWWGQTYKAQPGEGHLRPNLGMGDPDELLIDWREGVPHVRHWQAVGSVIHGLALAWHGAALEHGMGSEEELEQRQLLIGFEEGRGLLRLLCGSAVALTSKELQLRALPRVEEVLDREGELAQRWSVPGRQVELLEIAAWIERCVPEAITRTVVETAADGTTTERIEEWPARAELLQQWREGQALRAAGGGRIPPLPPRWARATTYGPEDRDGAWREALLRLRWRDEIHPAQARLLEGLARADGLTPEEITEATEAVLAEWLAPGEHRSAVLERTAHIEALVRLLEPARPGLRQQLPALLVTDPTGSGKSHRWAERAKALARETGLGAVLWLSKDRSTAVEPLRAMEPDWPPTRHGGLARDGDGQIKALAGAMPKGWSWAETPTCVMSDQLQIMRARGHSNAAINEWCSEACPHRDGCPYHSETQEFWGPRVAREIECDEKGKALPPALRGKGLAHHVKLVKPTLLRGSEGRPAPIDVVRCTPAMVPALAALVPYWLKRALVIVDETDHLRSACSSTYTLQHQHLQQLHQHLQARRLAMVTEERKGQTEGQTEATGAQQLPSDQLGHLLELIEGLMQLTAGAPGRHGLSPRQLSEHDWFSLWRRRAVELGLDRVLLEERQAELLGALDEELDVAGLYQALGGQAPEEAGADPCPPLLLALVRGALGPAASWGSTVLWLTSVRPKGKARGKGKAEGQEREPGYAVAITAPTGLGQQLATSCGALVLLDATASPEATERTLTATAGRTDRPVAPVGVEVLQLLIEEPTDTHRVGQAPTQQEIEQEVERQKQSRRRQLGGIALGLEEEERLEQERQKQERQERLRRNPFQRPEPAPISALRQSAIEAIERRRQEQESRRHPPVRVLQVVDAGSFTRERRDTLTPIRTALIAEISDWIRATYGEAEETGVIDHLPFCRRDEESGYSPAMAAAGIRPEQGWLTTGARGGNLLAGVRGLALFGLPIPNLNSGSAEALALADWADPETPPDELGLAIEEGRARALGAELMQAIGRPRWNRQSSSWGQAVLIVIGTGDLSALLPAIPGATDTHRVIHSTSVTDTHRVLNASTGDIEEITAEWFGQQLGRGEEGLVARARSQRSGQAAKAQVAGKARASSKTSQRTMAIREQIREAVVEMFQQRVADGQPPAAVIRGLSARALANAIGSTDRTVRQHLKAMAAACDPAFKARGDAAAPEEAVEVLIRFEAHRTRADAA